MTGIVRGPDGKFRSADMGDFDRREQIVAGWAMSIPSADLGTETFESDDGEQTILVDFDDVLHQDEVFDLVALQVRAAIFATESNNAEDLEMHAQVALTDDLGTGVAWGRDPPSMAAASPNTEVGIIDYNDARQDEDSTWIGAFTLYADSGMEDSTNQYGQAQTSDTINEWWPVAHLEVTFDEDDELVAPWRIQHRDAATDMNFSIGCVIHGAVRELD